MILINLKVPYKPGYMTRTICFTHLICTRYIIPPFQFFHSMGQLTIILKILLNLVCSWGVIIFKIFWYSACELFFRGPCDLVRGVVRLFWAMKFCFQQMRPFPRVFKVVCSSRISKGKSIFFLFRSYIFACGYSYSL